MVMEENLKSHIERTWALHDKISDYIQYSCIGFGGFYSQYNNSGGFSEDPFSERESLSAIRDALRMLENLLLCLQRLRSQHETERHAALMRLEESRLFLLERIAEHQGRAQDVIKEMLTIFRDQNSIFNRNSNNSYAKKVEHSIQNTRAFHTRKRKNRIMIFLSSFFKVLSYPWKLHRAAGMVSRFALVIVGIVSVFQILQIRQQHITRREEMIQHISNSYGRIDYSLMKSTERGNLDFLQHISNSPLDVFHGRG